MPGSDEFESLNASPADSGMKQTLADLSARVAALEDLVAMLQEQEPGQSLNLRDENPHLDSEDNLPPNSPATYFNSEVTNKIPRAAVSPPLGRRPPPSILASTLIGSRGKGSLEDRLGSQVFNLIGVIAIIVGTSWALKLAIEHGLIGPAARVVLGLVVGAAIVLWSEHFRRRGYAAFSYTLKAMGSGILYLVVWAAMQLYHLLPASVALTAMLLVTAWNAWMAWTQDAQLLAAYALAGGLATPVLLSTGGDHETFLFSYLALIVGATVLLVRVKPWQRLLIPAYLATAAYFIGWYTRFFRTSAQPGFDGQSGETTAFVAVFCLLFALVSIRARKHAEDARDDVIADGLTPLANAAFVGLALYSVFEDSGLHSDLAWLMAGLGAIFLGLMRLQRSRLAAAMHLVAAVVFLTAAIPLKSSGHTLTVAWLVEAFALYWAATLLSDPARQAAWRSLTILAAGCYALGLGSLVLHWWWLGPVSAGFWTANLASALVAVAVSGGAVWLTQRVSEHQAECRTVCAGALIAVDSVALLLAFGVAEVPSVPVAFANSRFFSALVALAVLAAAAWTSYRLHKRWATTTMLFLYLAGTTVVLSNLVAILATRREIGALFLGAGADAGLERSLAISGFLMAYGAILLAAGFWRRSPLLRWQALLLLIFTIFKVFLYDTSGLSQGYRVVSFLALGALLLGVSFAYQKDWLGLKQSGAEATDGRA